MKTRIQLDLTESSLNRLKTLKDETEAASYTEVVKNALRLYESLIDETKKGNELSVKYAEGDRVAYKLLF